MRPLTADFLNNEDKEHTGEPVDLEGKTVAELKTMLREQGLPVSGTKAQLVERLQGNSVDGNLLSLEEEVKGEAELPGEDVPWWRSTEILTPQALTSIGVVVLMVTAVFVFRPTWLGFEPSYEYELIDYDADQTLTFAQELFALGHGDLEGRMRGTTEEANKSAYIDAKFA